MLLMIMIDDSDDDDDDVDGWSRGVLKIQIPQEQKVFELSGASLPQKKSFYLYKLENLPSDSIQIIADVLNF